MAARGDRDDSGIVCRVVHAASPTEETPAVMHVRERAGQLVLELATMGPNGFKCVARATFPRAEWHRLWARVGAVAP